MGRDNPSLAALRDTVEDLVQRMNREADAVIVEGSKDERGLRAAGLTIPVMTYSRVSIWLFVHRLKQEHDRVVILTDFDEKGEEYNAELQDRLTGTVTVLQGLRKAFGKALTQTGRRDIESLNNVFNAS